MPLLAEYRQGRRSRMRFPFLSQISGARIGFTLMPRVNMLMASAAHLSFTTKTRLGTLSRHINQPIKMTLLWSLEIGITMNTQSTTSNSFHAGTQVAPSRFPVSKYVFPLTFLYQHITIESSLIYFSVNGANLPGFNENATLHFVPGKTYRLRVINTSALAMFHFWIDGHDMRVIEVDGVCS